MGTWAKEETSGVSEDIDHSLKIQLYLVERKPISVLRDQTKITFAPCKAKTWLLFSEP